MEDKWLNEWQKKLDGYEVAPPDGLWDGINKALEERRLSVASSRGRRTVWLRLAGIAAALAIVVPLGRNVCRPVFTSLVENRIQTEDILPEPSDVFWAKVRRVKKESYRGKPFGKDTVTFCDRPIVSEEGQEILTEERKELVAEREKTVSEDTLEYMEKAYPDGIDRHTKWVVNVGKVKTESSHLLAISLFASNTPGKSVMNHGNGGVALMGAIPSWEHPETMGYGKYPVAGIKSAHPYVDDFVPMKHKQPVRFGVSVCYALNERFGIESGLSYTYLSSSLSSSGEDYSYKVRQSLQYVGIPLNFKASLWKKRWMDLYLSAGGMAEKCVDGDSETDYMWRGRIKSSTHKAIREKPWQCSVNASAGMQFNLSSVVGLYVEPGVSYYFDNGSSVSNIYKEKPLNFNLEFGLRFSLGL